MDRRVFDELTGYHIEELSVGMSAFFAKTVTEADIVTIAGVSGDFNPLHINEEYARETRFKGRIAHGMMSAVLISAAIAMKLPGPGAIYVSQNLKFQVPVRIGDTVLARVTVKEIIPERNRVVLATVCTVGETVMVDGEAVMIVPSLDEGSRSSTALKGRPLVVQAV
jgi:3-hydroxybutyryl-CoA dehydratase